MINKETIDNIIEACRIEEVVGDFVSLKKRGVNMIGLCPFHNEKTPSFTVSPTKGIFKCFGCGKAGNSVNFIMEHEKISYPEALRYLAHKYNIEIAEEHTDFSPEEIQKNSEKESLYIVHAFAQKYFSSVLFDTEEGLSIAMSYFKERGFNEDIIRKFQLGYNPDKYSEFSKNALSNGYNPEYLIKSGISYKKDDELIDRFRGRVIFPVHNITGRVIAFGGRILTSDKSKAKYVNSPETEIYHKSNILYGIYFAKKSIIEQDNCYLVEGYTDVISLHQTGIENVVASSGTSLTTEQIRLIHRYTNNITILYDGDDAGIKASFRGIDMILEEGMNVKIVLFEDKEDPDSFARKNSSEIVKNFIANNAKDFIKFKTNLLLKDTQNDPVKKAALIKEIISSVAIIPEPITRSLYIHECSEMLDVEEQTLLNELNKYLRSKFSRLKQEKEKEDVISEVLEDTVHTEKQFDLVNSSNEYHEKEIIKYLLFYGNNEINFPSKDEFGHDVMLSYKVASYIINDLNNDGLTLQTPIYKAILDEFSSGIENGVIPDQNYFIFHQNKEISETCTNIIYNPYHLSSKWTEKHNVYITSEDMVLDDAVINLINSFKLNRINEMISEIQKEIKAKNNSDDTLELLEKQMQLIMIKKTISDVLSRVVLK
ncbi:MAG: DNA primase [Bacteroidota bacterium]|nr:DNA primase [Bacteroidota bacterium]